MTKKSTTGKDVFSVTSKILSNVNETNVKITITNNESKIKSIASYEAMLFDRRQYKVLLRNMKLIIKIALTIHRNFLI